MSNDTEVQVEAETATSTASGSDVNWSDIDVGFDDDGAYAVEPDSRQETQNTPIEAAPKETPVASQEQQTVPQPEVQPAQQPAQPVQPAQKSFEEQLAEYEQALMQQYALSEDDAIAIATQPETVLPRFAKNMHLRMMREVQQQIQQALQTVPLILQYQAAQQKAEEEAKQEFYSVWPGLKDHHDTVVRNALLVRQSNPQATRQQIIEMAGVMTAMGVGLDPATVRQTSNVRQQAPQQVTKPIAPRPAPNGMAQQSGNIFTDFADEDIDFLRG